MSNHTEEVADAYADHLLDKENVVGVGGGEDKVLVLVTKKVPESELSHNDIVDRTLDGERTDVIEVGHIEAKLDPGTSIGVPNKGTGTAGAVVVDMLGQHYVLTNNHVAAGVNSVPVLSSVHSPGPADGLGPRFGVLDRFQPIHFGAGKSNVIDAALVRLDRPASFTHPNRVITPKVGWGAVKIGRTSGRTEGKVEARKVVVDVNMGFLGTARFRHQIMTSHMLEPGDSGSLMTTVAGIPFGLGFAGSDTVSFANPIRPVLSLLGVNFR